jgi:hypothetical protein
MNIVPDPMMSVPAPDTSVLGWFLVGVAVWVLFAVALHVRELIVRE